MLLGQFHLVHAEPESSSLPKGYHRVSTDKKADIQKLCQATADTGLFSGAVLVAEKGQVIYKGAFGMANREWLVPNTIDTRYRLASVSKQFCSMLVLQLVQENKIKLEDKITDHLHYYRNDTGDRITIHHLMAHQSGIKDFTADFDYRSKISRLSYEKDEFIKQHCSHRRINSTRHTYNYCFI